MQLHSNSLMLGLMCVFEAERNSMSCIRGAAEEIRKINSSRGDILKLMSRDKTEVLEINRHARGSGLV